MAARLFSAARPFFMASAVRPPVRCAAICRCVKYGAERIAEGQERKAGKAGPRIFRSRAEDAGRRRKRRRCMYGIRPGHIVGTCRIRWNAEKQQKCSSAISNFPLERGKSYATILYAFPGMLQHRKLPLPILRLLPLPARRPMLPDSGPHGPHGAAGSSGSCRPCRPHCSVNICTTRKLP